MMIVFALTFALGLIAISRNFEMDISEIAEIHGVDVPDQAGSAWLPGMIYKDIVSIFRC